MTRMAAMTSNRKHINPYALFVISLPAFAASWISWRSGREWSSGYCAGIAFVIAGLALCVLLGRRFAKDSK
jgi:hypothetical protein